MQMRPIYLPTVRLTYGVLVTVLLYCTVLVCNVSGIYIPFGIIGGVLFFMLWILGRRLCRYVTHRWQPGGWINIKHNKNKNYIIIMIIIIIISSLSLFIFGSDKLIYCTRQFLRI